MAIIDNYTKDELAQIVSQSTSMKEVVDKLGYSTHSGSNNNTVKARIERYDIDTSHFSFTKGIERNEENVFIKNSTASQATLRRWYLKGNYTQYKCSICGQEPFWHGKELTLILDHINGENHDDRLENLRWVCPNCNQQLDTTGFSKKQSEKKEKIVKKYYCIDYGKEISKECMRCKNCSLKKQTIPLEEMPLTKKELKDFIRTIPFTQIAQKYGMTDNGIKRWCDKFNLPRTKRDINFYSDEEWENI